MGIIQSNNLNQITTHHHAQQAADLYRRLLIAARDYPYRDFKDTRDEFLALWQNCGHVFIRLAVRQALHDAELDILGPNGKLPNLFPAGHPRC